MCDLRIYIVQKYFGSMDKSIKLFENKNIRVEWDDDKSKYFFFFFDVINVLTDNNYQVARKYWNKLSQRLKEEGNETVTNCHQLKMLASDGKMRLTDVADTEQLLRLIQSIPSKKAEPFKLWLAKVGNERIDEIHDPELSIDRALETYLKKGYSKDWINQRIKTIEVRKQLTHEWNRVGIKKKEDYAILTDEITRTWSDNTVKEYKILKGLRKENLRDNMTNMELVINMLAEVTTKEISEIKDPKIFSESKDIAKEGGEVAKNTRKDIESKLGKSIISSKNEIHKLS